MGLTADDSLLFDLTKPGIYLKWNNFPLRCVPCASVWMGWERAPYWGWANEVGRWFIWFDFMAETVSELRNKCHGTICQLRGSLLFFHFLRRNSGPREKQTKNNCEWSNGRHFSLWYQNHVRHQIKFPNQKFYKHLGSLFGACNT